MTAELLKPAEVALAFRVDPKTVVRWANAGRLPSVRTPGGHRRFFRADVEALLRRTPSGGVPPVVEPMRTQAEIDRANAIVAGPVRVGESVHRFERR